MQHLKVSGAVRPLKWSLGVKWLITLFHCLEGIGTQGQIRCILILSVITSKFRTVLVFLIVKLKILLNLADDISL